MTEDQVAAAFALLECKANSSRDEVKASYRQLVRVWHPDRFETDAQLKEKATDKMKLINEAYQLLERLFEERQSQTEFTRQEHAPFDPEKQNAAPNEPAKEEYHVAGTQKFTIKMYGPLDDGRYSYTKEAVRVVDFDGRRLFSERSLFQTKLTEASERFEVAAKHSMSFTLSPKQGIRSSYSFGSNLVEPHDKYTFPDGSSVIIGRSTLDILFNNILHWSAARSELKDIEEDYRNFENSQNWKQCVLAAQKAIDLHSANSWGWINRSCAMHRLSMTGDAFAALKQAVELFPNSTTVGYNMACYCSILGDASGAKKWLSSVFRLARSDGSFERYRKLAEIDSDLARIRSAVSQIAFFSKVSKFF